MTTAKRGYEPFQAGDALELERRLFAAGEELHQARLRLRRARDVVRDAEKALLAARQTLEESALQAAEHAEILEGLQAEIVRLSPRTHPTRVVRLSVATDAHSTNSRYQPSSECSEGAQDRARSCAAPD
jgi:phosphoenolpyruvate carboxylase